MKNRHIRRRVLWLMAAVVAVGMLIGGASMLKAHAGSLLLAHADYVGAAACASCHAEETEAWRRSHHAQAMAVATEQTVLGDFNDATIEDHGRTTRFYRREGKYYLATGDSGGPLSEYEVQYSFGVFPLQQYLIPTGKGRLQALDLAWDARPQTQGGQRWFALPASGVAAHGDAAWTGVMQNWNFMCADCHSTHLQKNYRADQDRFETRWSDINVACEACHGPGSAHLRWAEAKRSGLGRWLVGADPWLQRRFTERQAPDRIARLMEPDAALRSMPGAEIDACAQCHSRRSQLVNTADVSKPFTDQYTPALLGEPAYHVDGQIREEDYEYGAFQQSHMFAKGVTCSDCHDPHTAELRRPGNALCLQCHEQTLDSPAHHFHTRDSAAAQCVSCHMPTSTYMVVDARRDHGIRVPRPDLSVKLGVPNACNRCHTDRDASWAADWIVRRYGPVRKDWQHYAEPLAAIRSQAPEAEAAIADLLAAQDIPNLIKVTALSEAGPYLGEATDTGVLKAVRKGLHDEDARIRLGALQALDSLPPAQRWDEAATLLGDTQRSVRIEAARLLGAIATLDEAQRRQLQPAWDEFTAALAINADRPEWHSSYAALLSARGDTDAALAELRRAIELEPGYAPAYLNLADLYREAGQDPLGETALSRGLDRAPDDAGLHFALGLLRVRQKNMVGGVRELQRAAALDPDNGQFGYTCAVALDANGDTAAAKQLLRASLQGRQQDRGEFYLLIQLLLRDGEGSELSRYLPKLQALAAKDERARALLQQVSR